MQSVTQTEKLSVDITDSAIAELRNALKTPGREGKSIRLVYEGFG
jgi:hypothetical protein